MTSGDLRCTALALTTPLPAPEEQLVLAYDAAMERHCDDEPHPECPERTARIWAGLEEAGVDYQRALKEFEEAKVEGKINPEGFEEK